LTSAVVAVITEQSSADSTISTSGTIPGDNNVVTDNPASTAPEMSAAALASEPQLPYTPVIVGSTTPARSEGQYITLSALI
jgi:hypothetical protein